MAIAGCVLSHGGEFRSYMASALSCCARQSETVDLLHYMPCGSSLRMWKLRASCFFLSIADEGHRQGWSWEHEFGAAMLWTEDSAGTQLSMLWLKPCPFHSCKCGCSILDAFCKLLAGSCRSPTCILGQDITSPVFDRQMCIDAYNLLVTCKRLHGKNPLYLSDMEAMEAEMTEPLTVRSDAAVPESGGLRGLHLVPEPAAEEEPGIPQFLAAGPGAQPEAQPTAAAHGGGSGSAQEAGMKVTVQLCMRQSRRAGGWGDSCSADAHVNALAEASVVRTLLAFSDASM